MKPCCLSRYTIEVQWGLMHQGAEVVHPNPPTSDTTVGVLGEGVDFFVWVEVTLVDFWDDFLTSRLLR